MDYLQSSEIDETNSDQPKLNLSGDCLVMFSAKWCRPCQGLTEELVQLIPLYQGRIRFVKVDVDQFGDLADTYQVEGLPTIFLMRNNQILTQFQGGGSLEEIKEGLLRMNFS